MRRWKPWLGQILAVLLLIQWGGSLTACLETMRWDPAQVLCHLAPEDGGKARDGEPGQAMASGCPLCAPLPPGLLPVLPDIPPPRPAATQLGAAPPAITEAPPAPRPRPQQPRAPPALS